MNLLWLINVPLPEASKLLNEKPSPFGGWLINASNALADCQDVNLTIVFVKNGISNYIRLKGDKITYYACRPVTEHNGKMIENNEVFNEILEEVNPDIVHIYGTELAHTLSMVNACKKQNIKTVISIQGLVSIYAQHMYANLPFKAILGFTFRNILRNDHVWGHKRLFSKRGINEIEALKNTKHVIGRTTWDKACTMQINPEAQYHFCNETLREEFYKRAWSFEKCEKYSIFLSQGQYPIKGLHYMLEAMPYILERFPEAKVYISGKDITKSDTLKNRLLITYYGKYIKSLIKKYKLNGNVIFTGPLDEVNMCERYLKSNVFVCPSSIENSPNSLGEAMILGVPSIASNVGGVADMLTHNKEGYVYQTDAPYMLAHYVCELFEKEDIAQKFSENARVRALQTHSKEDNLQRTLEIYNIINE